jgi:hypothetical protein
MTLLYVTLAALALVVAVADLTLALHRRRRPARQSTWPPAQREWRQP